METKLKNQSITLVKSDVGLGNVDNTSDATKNSASATLTNKLLSATTVYGELTNTENDGFYPKFRGTLTDFDTAISRGEYMFAGTNIPHAPTTGTIYGIVRVMVSTGNTQNNTDNWCWQEAWNTSGNYYTRSKVNSGAWTSWTQRW